MQFGMTIQLDRFLFCPPGRELGCGNSGGRLEYRHFGWQKGPSVRWAMHAKCLPTLGTGIDQMAAGLDGIRMQAPPCRQQAWVWAVAAEKQAWRRGPV